MKNLLVIHIDALRTDVTELIKKKENKTLSGFEFLETHYPKIHNCYSHAISTIYSIAGYLTGTYPFINTVLNNDTGEVPASIKFIGECLREQGYSSKAFITTGPKHDANFVRMGIKRCFDEVEFLHSPDGFLEDQYPSSMLADNYGKDIIGRCNEGNKYFTYVTLLDMHVWNGRYIDANWDEYYNKGCLEVNYFLKEVLPNIDLNKTMVVVIGDHGFKFDFDQIERNAYNLFGDVSGYEPLIKVGAYISELPHPIYSRTRLVDLFSTILLLLGIKNIPVNNGLPILSNLSQVETLFRTYVYSEIGMLENPKRNIDTRLYKVFLSRIEATTTSTVENALSNYPIPEKHNFSVLMDNYQIMFDIYGCPMGLFAVDGNGIKYDRNLIYKIEEVLQCCQKAEAFIKYQFEKFNK